MSRKTMIVIALLLAFLLAGSVALLSFKSEQMPEQVSQVKAFQPKAESLVPQPETSEAVTNTTPDVSITSKPVKTPLALEQAPPSTSTLERPLDAAAISSLATTMTQGDSRAPTIGEFEPDILPTAEQLADPDLYLEYEQNQKQRLHRAWVVSADKKIEEIEGYIQMAESRYLDPKELEQGLKKVEGLKTMQKQLQEQLQIPGTVPAGLDN